jgi:hypothetical protein
MLRRSAPVGLAQINDRRAREEAGRVYHAAERADQFVRERANFDIRGANRYRTGELRRRSQLRAMQSELSLDERRVKLSTLLRREEDQFVSELRSTVETPQTRRRRLMGI